jgi:hypothetical protein
LITHIILYRFVDTAIEMAPIPVPSKPGMIRVTLGMSDFLTKVERQAGLRRAEAQAAADLLFKQKISINEYVDNIAIILGRTPQAGIHERLAAEYAICIAWMKPKENK